MKKRLGNNFFIEVKKHEKIETKSNVAYIVTYKYTNENTEHTATLHTNGLYFYDKEYHRKHYLSEFH